MVGHRWIPWINNPTSGSISGTSGKQEQEISSDCCRHVCPVGGLSALCLTLLVTCVALSVLYSNKSNSRPEWRSLLFDYQNISESYLTLTEANADLRGDNEMLKKHSARLEKQTELLNRTSDKLMSVNLALTSESAALMEQIVNLSSTNLKLTQEHEHLVQHVSEQEGEKLNMSQTIKQLVDSNTQREEEQRRLSEVSSLLRGELSPLKEKNQELRQINGRIQGEIKNLREQVGALLNCDKASKLRATELQEQNQNLSSTLMTERQEAAERQDRRRNGMELMEAEMHSMKEAYHSLDLYCPVVNHKTKERICKKCQERWRLFDNKCYYFSSRRLGWSSSRAWCRTQGGDLLVVDSEPEQNFVFETSRALDPSGTRLWIGLTDAEEEGEWLWVDGSSLASDVQYWLSRPGMSAEPDDWKLDDPLGEDCGHMDTSEKTLKSWMDGSCKIPYRWICEKNV